MFDRQVSVTLTQQQRLAKFKRSPEPLSGQVEAMVGRMRVFSMSSPLAQRNRQTLQPRASAAIIKAE